VKNTSRHRARRTPARQRGFSLLEILVAFSIFALSITLLLNIFSSGVRLAIIAEEYNVATMIAQSALEATGIETAWRTGELTGVIDDYYHWSVAVREAQMDLDLTDAEANAYTPLQITATVRWGEGQGAREVVLQSLRLIASDKVEK